MIQSMKSVSLIASEIWSNVYFLKHLTLTYDLDLQARSISPQVTKFSCSLCWPNNIHNIDHCKIIEKYEEKIKIPYSDHDLQARSISPKVTTFPIHVEHKYQV